MKMMPSAPVKWWSPGTAKGSPLRAISRTGPLLVSGIRNSFEGEEKPPMMCVPSGVMAMPLRPNWPIGAAI